MDEVTALMCFLISCAIGIQLVRTQAIATPQVVIVESNQTVREGESVSFLCIVSNPVAGSTFVWTRNAAGTLSAYSPDTSYPRITVTVVSGTSSTFMITNLSLGDSGLISCRYTYLVDGTISMTINADRSVCVASQLESPPSCLEGTKIGETIQLVCSAVNICPDDVTLRWFDVGGMAELTGVVTRGTNVIEHQIITSRPGKLARNYLCKLESRLFPNVHLNCTSEQSPLGVSSTIKSLASISSTKYPTTTPAFELLSTYSMTTGTDTTSTAIDEQKTKHMKTPVDITDQTLSSIVNIVTTSISKSRSVNSVTDRKCVCGNCKSSCDSDSSEWVVSTTALLSIIACISITINVYFGLRLYHKREEKPTPAASSKDKARISHLQEPYMELGVVDEPNKTYTALKTGSVLSAQTGAEKSSDYEVTLPSMPSEDVNAAKNGGGIEKDNHSEKPKEKHYVNADRIKDFSRRFKKPANN